MVDVTLGADWPYSAIARLFRVAERPIKPSALRGYEQSLRLRLLPALGGAKLGEIRRSDVQRLVNRMMADGLGPSTCATRSCRCGRSTARH
jgi:hypothetical protein